MGAIASCGSGRPSQVTVDYGLSSSDFIRETVLDLIKDEVGIMRAILGGG